MRRAAIGVRVLLVLGILNALPGCHRAVSPPAGIADLRAPASGPGNAGACQRNPLQVTDVAGILAIPITEVRAVSGDAQSCEFATASFPAITVSLRPGLGISTVDAWIAGRMPLRGDPLGGVGDKAVWQSSLHEVIAQKRDLLCDIQARGAPEDFAVKAEALPVVLGALCNRVFDGSAVHS